MKKVMFLTFLLLLFILGHIRLLSQNMEVEGNAKITVMDTLTGVSANVVRQSDGTLALRQYKVGDLAQGGIVFYIDESGEHGIVADTADIISTTRWYAGTSGDTQSKGDGPFAGEMNTTIIISSQVSIGDDGSLYVARVCAELQKGGYGDWYLPSKRELYLMYKNLHVAGLGGFTSAGYWSSTEDSSAFAWAQTFADGAQFLHIKSGGARLRAVRAF